MASKVGDSCVIPKSADVSLDKKKNKLFAQVNLDRQFIFYAESGGFEPSIRLRVYRISSAALSTTQTTFLFSACKGTAFILIMQIDCYFFIIIALQMYHRSRKSRSFLFDD